MRDETLGEIDEAFELSEPRILLDAAIDFSFSDTLDLEATIESMSALIRLFEEQFDPDEAGLLGLLQSELLQGLDGMDDLFSLVEGQDGTGFGELEDLFERVCLSGMQVVEEYRADLNDIFIAIAFVDTKALDLESLRNDQTDENNLTPLELIDSIENSLRINDDVFAPGTTLSDAIYSDAIINQIFGNDLLWSGADAPGRIDAFF